MSYLTPQEYGLGSESSPNILTNYLHYITSFNYNPLLISSEKVNTLIEKIHSYIDARENKTTQLFCTFICKVLHDSSFRLQSDLEATSLTELFLDVLSTVSNAACVSNVLRALASVIYGQSTIDAELVDRLLTMCERVVDSFDSSKHLVNDPICSVSMIFSSFTLLPSSNEPYLEMETKTRIANITLKMIQFTNPEENAFFLDMLLHCMKTIRNLVAYDNCTYEMNVPVLLSVVNTYMFYGLTHDLSDRKGDNKADRKVLSPTAVPISILSDIQKTNKQDANPTLKTNSRKHRTKLKRYKEVNKGQTFSSESELSSSDTEVMRHSCDNKFLIVRRFSFIVFKEIIQAIDKRTLYSYWSCFLPHTDANKCYGHSPNTLFYSISEDPSSKVRLAALCSLTTLLGGSKVFLFAAEEINPEKIVNFHTFSQNLAAMIKHLHNTLFYCISNESFPHNMQQIFKCLSVLVSNTAYHKLNQKCLSDSVKYIKMSLNHRDNQVVLAAMKCLTCLINSCEKSQTMSNYLNSCEKSQTMSNYLQSPPSQIQVNQPTTVWLYVFCVNKLEEMNSDSMQKGNNNNIYCECLNLLSSLCIYHHCIIANEYSKIIDIAKKCIEINDDSVQINTSKLLESITKSIEKEEITDDIKDVWVHIMQDVLPCVFLSVKLNLNAKCGLCTCISNMNPAVYPLLSNQCQIWIVSLIIGLCSHEVESVRGTALRTIAFLVNIPELNQSISFIFDSVIAVMDSLTEYKTSIMFRMKASWCVSNICQVLVDNRNSNNEEFIEEFPDSLLSKLFDMSLTLSKDNSDKVKQNGVRALGKIFGYLDNTMISRDSKFTDLLDKSIESIISSVRTGSAKVRWNACYACSELFMNPKFHPSLVPLTLDIFKSLDDTFKNCTHFKVKISACCSLHKSPRREIFPPGVFESTFETLLDSLTLFSAPNTYNEDKQTNNLLTSIILGILTRFSMAKEADVLLLQTDKLNNILEHVDRFKRVQSTDEQRDLFDKMLSNAMDNMQYLKRNSIENGNRFENIILILEEFMKKEIDISEKTPFSQTYD